MAEAATILVVDDDERGRSLRARALSEARYRVVEAGTGREALEHARTGPDLVVLATELLDADGLALCRRLRAAASTVGIPVVLISRTGTEGDEACGESAADAYIAYPAEQDLLLPTVRALLRVRRAETDAAAAGTEWAATFDAASEGIAVLAIDGSVRRANGAFARLFDAEPGALVGRAFDELLCAAAPGTGLGTRDTLWPETGELRLGERWFAVSGGPISTSDGTLAGAVRLLTDVTALKRSQDAEREARLRSTTAAARVERLREIAAALNRAARRHEVVDVVAGSGLDALGAAVGVLALADAERDGALAVVATPGLAEEAARALAGANGEGALHQAARTGGPVLLATSGQLDARYPSLSAALGGIQRCAMLPLVVADRMVGLLCVGYATPGAFEADEVHYLLAFADQCAQALERAGLYERVAAEHERLEAILQQLPAGVLLAEASSGRLMLGNDEVERIWRRPFVEGASLAEWCDHYGFHPENGRPYAPHEWPVARALRGEVVRGEEADILRGDGSPGTIVTNAAPLRNADGQIVAAVAAFADVTELADARRAAEVVRDRNALLAEASELLSTEGGEAQKLAAVVRLVVPRVAPYCSLLLADREGDQEVLRRVATLHADGAARARVEAISPVIRVTAGERLPLVRAYLDGEPVVFEQPLGELYRLITDDDDELAAFRSLDVRSGIAVPVGGRRGALGSLVLGYTTEGSPDPDTIEFATEFARRAGLVIENSRLASSRVAARRSAERALERTQRLQQVTAALAGAADVDGAVGVLVEQVAEALGAVGAWVALMGPDGSTLELAGQRGFAGGFAERYRVLSPDAPTPTALAARTGEAGWYGSVAECVELFPGLAADRRELGLEALAVLPLLHGGVVLGVVAVSFAEQREFDEADRELIANVVAQCAQALERARLHQAERRARVASELAAARTARLQALTARLSAAVTALDVCDAVIDEALAALGACVGAVALLTESGKDFRNVRVVGHDQPVLDVFPEFPGDAPTPIGDAVRRREPVVLETIPDRTALYPHLGDGRRPAGPDGALVALPLFVEGRALGGLGLLFPDERTFGPADVAFMETLAAQCAQALERARLYDREHRIAETLQRSLLPEHLPELPGVTLAARYQAGGAGLHVGGDWYDAIPLDGARVMLAVGDVVGRGIRAAAIMGQLRNGLRAYALEGYTPAEALHRLNRLADELGGGPFATACVAVLDPARRSMTLASAGHPPAVVIGERGPRLLEAARSLPLAVSPTTGYVEAHVELPDGGAVAFYTDGLVEQRGESLDAGFARLMTAAASLPRDPERLADRLLALVPAEAADDVAILVAMLVAAPLHVAVPNEPEALAAARQELAAWLGRAGAGVQDVFDLTTAVGEALANAVEHARAPRERPILLDGRIDDGWAVLTVRDHGRWKPPVASDMRGFGLGLMRALTDDARVEPGDDGTVVTLRRALGNDRQEGLDR